MKKLKIGIVEDELVIAETIRETLFDLGYDATEAAISYSEALEMVRNESPDLLLCDIVLSGHNDGVDLAQEIRKSYNIPIIFLTSNSDQATVNRAKAVKPNGYLVKPFNSQDLYTAIEIAVANFQEKPTPSLPTSQVRPNSDALFIKQDNLYHKIKFNDILYVQSDHVYVEVYTRVTKLLVRSSLSDFMLSLPQDTFFRIQRGCAINLDHLETINHTYAIVAGHQLPVGKTYREELMQRLNIS